MPAPLRVPVELALVAAENARRGIDHDDPEAPPPRCFRLASDVTAERLRFAGALPYRVGTPLRVRFELPFDPPVWVETQGGVQRAAGRPSEVSLETLSGAAGEALARYLEEEEA